MTMSDEENDLVEVEEDEIEAVVKERVFELQGETEVELEDVDAEEDDFTGDREALVNFLVEMNQNNPVEIEFSQGDGDEAEEEEIEPVCKTRDPSHDSVWETMRERTGVIGDDEWEAVEADTGEGD